VIPAQAGIQYFQGIFGLPLPRKRPKDGFFRDLDQDYKFYERREIYVAEKMSIIVRGFIFLDGGFFSPCRGTAQNDDLDSL
jgi:hypothetical protein